MNLASKPRVVKEFTNGLNHDTYLIATNDDQFVLKLFSSPDDKAIVAQNIASLAGVAPTILYHNINNDVILLEYINSQVNHSQQLHESHIKKLATVMARLHSLPTGDLKKQFSNFDLIAYFNLYLKTINSKNTAIENIHINLQPVISDYLNDTTTSCFCHNDLVKENCLFTNDRTFLIDWEFAQINNPWFDLAGIFYYFSLTKSQARTLLKHYSKGWEVKVDSPIFYTSQCVLLWIDILWNLANKNSKIDKKINDLRVLTSQIGVTI